MNSIYLDLFRKDIRKSITFYFKDSGNSPENIWRFLLADNWKELLLTTILITLGIVIFFTSSFSPGGFIFGILLLALGIKILFNLRKDWRSLNPIMTYMKEINEIKDANGLVSFLSTTHYFKEVFSFNKWLVLLQIYNPKSEKGFVNDKGTKPLPFFPDNSFGDLKKLYYDLDEQGAEFLFNPSDIFLRYKTLDYSEKINITLFVEKTKKVYERLKKIYDKGGVINIDLKFLDKKPSQRREEGF